MDTGTMDLAFHDSRFTAEISKRMQVTIYEILKYRLMNNLMKKKYQFDMI